MHKFKIISLIIVLIILIFIYIYVKKENFDNKVASITTSPNPLSKEPISIQLRSEIGRVLGISPLRIYNVKWSGDINLNALNVDFDILDANVNQKVLHEISRIDASKLAMNLISQDNFSVKINNKTVIIRYLRPTNTVNVSKFDNEGLKDIKKYANDRYISVPNDESLTKFYTLEHDNNYNLVPKIRCISISCDSRTAFLSNSLSTLLLMSVNCLKFSSEIINTSVIILVY